MRNMRCTQCGEEAPVSRGTYRFVESGLSSVVLSGIEIARCQKCGNEDPIIPHANELDAPIGFGSDLQTMPPARSGCEIPQEVHGQDGKGLR